MKKWITGLAVLVLLTMLSATAMADIERQCNFCNRVTTGTVFLTEKQADQHTFLYYCNQCGWPSAITEAHYGDSSATCSEPGTCTICGEFYYDKDGHQWGSWQPAEDGKQHIRYCQYDSSHTDTEEHQADPTKPCTELQTCPVCSGSFYGPYNHEWSETCWPTEDGKQHYFVCTHDSSHIKLADHTSVQPATCRDPQPCAECGASYSNPNNHPDEREEIYIGMGYPDYHIKISLCAYCKAELSRTADLHSADPDRVSYSDYDEDWHIEFRYCSKCKDIVVGNSRLHTFSEATCVAPSTCVCGRTIGDPDPDSHDWGDWFYLDNKQHIRTCQRDGCAQTEYGNHTGGTATTAQAVCEICHSPYGDMVIEFTCPEPQTLDYDGEPHSLGVTVTRPVDATVTYTTDTGEPIAVPAFTDAGDYTVNYTITRTNYETETGTLRLTIKPFAITCTATGYTGVYDGAAHGVAISDIRLANAAHTVAIAYTVNGTPYTGSGAPAFTEAGEYAVGYTVSVPGNSSYIPAGGTVTVRINPAAYDTDSTQSAKGITADNVQPEDEALLRQALSDYQSALDAFGDRFTEAEKQEIQAAMERIRSALETLERAAAVSGAIAALPDAVEPDDTDAEARILAAKADLDALTAHEQALVGDAPAAKLDSLIPMLTAYRITRGDGESLIAGQNTALSFTANGLLAKLTAVLVDGEPLDTKHYTAQSGSTIITLAADYVKTLAVGVHTLTIRYKDGETSAHFTVTAMPQDLPQTGDSSRLTGWLALLGACCAGLLCLTRRRG